MIIFPIGTFLMGETFEKGPSDIQEDTGMKEDMTNKQVQFLTWLITSATDKCQTIEEVREFNKEIRLHSDGLIDEDVIQQVALKEAD